MSDQFKQEGPMNGSQWVASAAPSSLLGHAGPVRVDADAFTAKAPRAAVSSQPLSHREQAPVDLWHDPDALGDMAGRAADRGDRLVATMFTAARTAAAAHQRPVIVRDAAKQMLAHRPGAPTRVAAPPDSIVDAFLSDRERVQGREMTLRRWRITWTCVSVALVGATGYLFVSGMFMLPAATQRVSLQPLPVIDAQPPAAGPPAPEVELPMAAAGLPSVPVAVAVTPPLIEDVTANRPGGDVMALASLLVPAPTDRERWTSPVDTQVDMPAQPSERVEPRPIAEALAPQEAEPVEAIVIATPDESPAAAPLPSPLEIEPLDAIVIVNADSEPEPAAAPPPAYDPEVVFLPPAMVDASGVVYDAPEQLPKAKPQPTATASAPLLGSFAAVAKLWSQPLFAVDADPVPVMPQPSSVKPMLPAPSPADASVVFEMPERTLAELPADAPAVFEKPKPVLAESPVSIEEPIVAKPVEVVEVVVEAPAPVVVLEAAPTPAPAPEVIAPAPVAVVAEAAPDPEPIVSDDVPTLTLTAPEPVDDGRVRFAPGVAEWINSADGPWQSALWRDLEPDGAKPQSTPQPQPHEQPSTPEVPAQAAAILDRVFKPIQKVLDQQP